MYAEERAYGSFDDVMEVYQQIVTESIQLKRLHFGSGCLIEFLGDSGTCETFCGGWISMICWTSDTNSMGSLTVDIGIDDGKYKTYNARGFLLCSKSITSISQNTEGRDRILTVSQENNKLQITFVTLTKVFKEHDIRNLGDPKCIEKFEKECRALDRKKHDDEHRKRSGKQKEKRKVEDTDKKKDDDRRKQEERKRNDEDKQPDKKEESDELPKEKRQKYHDMKRNLEEQSHEDGITLTSTTLVNGAVEGALPPCISIDNHEDQQHDELDKRAYAQGTNREGLSNEDNYGNFRLNKSLEQLRAKLVASSGDIVERSLLKLKECLDNVKDNLIKNECADVTGPSKCLSKTKHIEPKKQIVFSDCVRPVPVCEIKPFIDVRLFETARSPRRLRQRTRTIVGSTDGAIEQQRVISGQNRGRARGRGRGRAPRRRNSNINNSRTQTTIVIDDSSEAENFENEGSFNEDLLATTILETL
ncbi:putative replication protein [Human betaherpesvirus 6A]|uniref:Protein U79/U80 n=1 Tax=Human herpesvirus 6A (strain Uganda-1102) TaxID=10370 RepID=U79_HHV6U|nr:putative replication protein [Human betaherpesvirus 6A]P52529.2 RecName: Full=Protein U79/U80 [Human herpesvirus 6 (strain Uganda-1102)]CAA58371.2 putative replication protein [Human betaherpesvirus 6A]